MIYYLNAGVALLVAWLLAFAITIDRHHIRRAWRLFLILITVEQALLAVSAIEALSTHVKIGYRQPMFAAIIIVLFFAIIFVLSTIRNPRSYWYGRDEDETDAAKIADPSRAILNGSRRGSSHSRRRP